MKVSVSPAYSAAFERIFKRISVHNSVISVESLKFMDNYLCLHVRHKFTDTYHSVHMELKRKCILLVRPHKSKVKVFCGVNNCKTAREI